MKFLTALLFAAAFLLRIPSHAQVTVDDKRDQIEALKIELEQAKQNRDKVIAKRWDSKQRDNDAREKFNQEYDDLKSKLDLKTQDADRLHAQIQNDLRDAEEAAAQAENERVLFLSLGSVLHDKTREIAEPLGKSFPTQIPERLKRLNEVMKSSETKREAPGEILNDLMDFERSELAITRDITLEHRGFLRANKTPGKGIFLRLGVVTSSYRDDKTGQVAMMLKNAPGTSFTTFDWHEDLPVATVKSLTQMMQVLDKQSGKVVMLPVDVLLTQNATKSYTHESKKGFLSTLMGTVKTGGIFMWPLLIIPFIVVGLFILKLLQLLRARGSHAYEEAFSKLEKGDMTGAAAISAKYPGNLALRILSAAASLKQGVHRNEAEKTIRELMLYQVPKLERHLTTLSVLAAAAPLLGLLGTVSGLIAMFQIITEHGVNDPKLLAGGIGEALIATETGLLIAIPTLLGHNYLANRVDDAVAEAEYHGMKALNVRWPKE